MDLITLQFQKEQNTNLVNLKNYSPGEINISGKIYNRVVLIDESNVSSFDVSDFESLSGDHLANCLNDDTEILIVGSGSQHKMLSAQIINQINKQGVAIEVMATRPACHTFQVLVHERRKVKALLYP